VVAVRDPRCATRAARPALRDPRCATRAARPAVGGGQRLGIARSSLYRKIDAFGISGIPDPRA